VWHVCSHIRPFVNSNVMPRLYPLQAPLMVTVSDICQTIPCRYLSVNCAVQTPLTLVEHNGNISRSQSRQKLTVSKNSAPNPQSDAEQLEAAADQAIAACGGDARETVKALLVANEFLEAEIEASVSRGYIRGVRHGRFNTYSG
jgi:hypothetical protein